MLILAEYINMRIFVGDEALIAVKESDIAVQLLWSIGDSLQVAVLRIGEEDGFKSSE